MTMDDASSSTHRLDDKFMHGPQLGLSWIRAENWDHTLRLDT